jgi:hypothetical protein
MFIHNISNEEKTYIGQSIAPGDFWSIPESSRFSYGSDEDLVRDIMLGEAAVSIDGSTDLDEKVEMIHALMGHQIVTKQVIAEGGKRKTDRGTSFTAAQGVTTSHDYLIGEDLQIKGGILITDNSELLDSIGMDVVDTSYIMAGNLYPSEPFLAGLPVPEGTPWSAVAPTGVVLHSYIKDFPVSKNGETYITNEAITTTPLNGLTIRIHYNSTGTSDVKCNVGILAYT